MFVPCDGYIPIPLGNPSPLHAAKKKKRDPGSGAGETLRAWRDVPSI